MPRLRSVDKIRIRWSSRKNKRFLTKLMNCSTNMLRDTRSWNFNFNSNFQLRNIFEIFQDFSSIFSITGWKFHREFPTRLLIQQTDRHEHTHPLFYKGKKSFAVSQNNSKTLERTRIKIRWFIAFLVEIDIEKLQYIPQSTQTSH